MTASRFWISLFVAAGASGIASCGGGGESNAAPAPAVPTPSPAPAPGPAPAPSADWVGRISGPGVVWYHNFDTAAEVNQFRWTGGFNGGQDPNSLGTGGSLVIQVASGGADGGGFMPISYPAGSSAGERNSYWRRPLNPIT